MNKGLLVFGILCLTGITLEGLESSANFIKVVLELSNWSNLNIRLIG